jgi:hypothetical protein
MHNALRVDSVEVPARVSVLCRGRRGGGSEKKRNPNCTEGRIEQIETMTPSNRIESRKNMESESRMN